MWKTGAKPWESLGLLPQALVDKIGLFHRRKLLRKNFRFSTGSFHSSTGAVDENGQLTMDNEGVGGADGFGFYAAISNIPCHCEGAKRPWQSVPKKIGSPQGLSALRDDTLFTACYSRSP